MTKLYLPLAAALIMLAPVNAQNSQPAMSSQSPQAASKPTIQWSKIRDINASAPGDHLYVEAKISSAKSPEPGSNQPWKISLEDNTGVVEMIVFQDVWQDYQVKQAEMNKSLEQAGKPLMPSIDIGSIVQVYGLTQDYTGTRQFKVENANSFRLSPRNGAMVTPVSNTPESVQSTPASQNISTIGSLTRDRVGETVTVDAAVESYRPYNPSRSNVPAFLDIKDSSGSIQVVFWTDVHTGIQNRNLEITPEQPIQITGELSAYKGNLQIRLGDIDSIQIAGN